MEAIAITKQVANKTRRRMQKTANDVITSNGIVTTIISLLFVYVFTILSFVKQFWSPLYRLFFASRHPVIVRTPEDRFLEAGLNDLDYTFASNYINIPFGINRANDRPRMHYLDESPNGNRLANSKTVLCLHGEPAWSFAFRSLIPKLVESGYRVIVPDFLGFGKSDKYVNKTNYNHEMHTFAIKHLINELGLGNNITLVGQDFGALVGMSIVKDMPDRFSNLVLLNAGLPTGFGENIFRQNFLENVQEFAPFFAWRSAILLLGANFPLLPLFRRLFGFNSPLVKAYNAPFPDSTYKGGVAQWPLLIPIYRDDAVAQHMVEVKSCLRVWEKPVLLVWGEQETMAKPYEKVFTGLMPHAKVVTIKRAGHFLLETHAEQTVWNVVEFLNKIDKSNFLNMVKMGGPSPFPTK